VTLRSKKQDVVSHSSAEAEYRAMTHTSCEMVLLKNLLMELNFRQSESMPMHCDNQFTIYIAQNLMFHERTKHIEIDCYLSEMLEPRRWLCSSSHHLQSS